MANDVGMRVEGGPALRASLRKAGQDLQDLKDVHKDAAELVVAAARPPVKSGRLAASGRAAGTANAAIMRWGGASLRYAGPIHFGWAAHNIEPQPFGTEAARATEPVWTTLYEDKVNDVLKTIKGV